MADVVRVTRVIDDESDEEGEEGSSLQYRLREEAGGLKHVSGDIFVNDVKAGSWCGVLVDRDRVGRGFFSVCDGESAELQEVSVKFCDSRGSPRLQALRQVEGTDRGGFLYMDEFKIDKPEFRLIDQPEFHTLVMGIFHGMSDPTAGTMAPLRMLNIGEVPQQIASFVQRSCNRTDIGAEALYQILHVEPSVAGHWTIAVYIPDMRDGLSPADQARVDEIRAALNPWPPSPDGTGDATPEDRAEMKALASLGEQANARQFIRAGFSQAVELVEGSDCNFFYATPASVVGHGSRMSHQAACQVAFVEKQPAPNPPSGLDLELYEIFENGRPRLTELLGLIMRSSGEDLEAVRQQLQQHVRTMGEEIVRLKDAGASIAGSMSIHFCAANYVPFGMCIPLLVELEPEAINGRDESNNTPLMVAAASVPMASSLNQAPDIARIEELVALGADRDLQDPRGRTAYGVLRGACSGLRDFYATFRLHAEQSDGEAEREAALDRAEAMLMPPGGPTEADLATMQSGGHAMDEDSDGGYGDY